MPRPLPTKPAPPRKSPPLVTVATVGLLLAAILGCSESRDTGSATRNGSAVGEAKGADAEGPPHDRSSTVVEDIPSADIPAAISVATYNINWGNARLDEVIETIRAADADVVCLQEVNGESLAALRREFADHYETIRFYGSVAPYAAGGFALLSRLEVASDEFLPPEYGLFGTCIFEVKLGDRSVQIASVHLQPVLFTGGGGIRGALDKVGDVAKAERKHEKEIGRIFENLSADVPTLIVGDFNSLATFKAPAFLREQGFVDGCASVHENVESQITWRWPLERGEVTLRIDYIFHSSEFTATTCETIESAGSDHYLLVSRLELE